MTFDPSGRWLVTGDTRGMVRYGSAKGEEPHLLFGHEGSVNAIAFHPDGRRLASAGTDTKIRLWPLPEGEPFHTLPREELLARLRALTNYRAETDESSTTGYRLGAEPISGWADLPTW